MVQLFELLGYRKLMRIWEVFLEDPKKTLTQTETLSRAKVAKATGIKWLSRLEDERLLTVERKGRMVFYRLNGNVLNKQLKIAATAASLMPLASLPEAQVYVYGSAARGEDRLDSDIDVLVIGKADKRDVTSRISALQKKLRKPIKPLVLNPLEWTQLKSLDPSFYERVDKDKVEITWT